MPSICRTAPSRGSQNTGSSPCRRKPRSSRCETSSGREAPRRRGLRARVRPRPPAPSRASCQLPTAPRARTPGRPASATRARHPGQLRARRAPPRPRPRSRRLTTPVGPDMQLTKGKQRGARGVARHVEGRAAAPGPDRQPIDVPIFRRLPPARRAGRRPTSPARTRRCARRSRRDEARSRTGRRLRRRRPRRQCGGLGVSGAGEGRPSDARHSGRRRAPRRARAAVRHRVPGPRPQRDYHEARR